MAILTWPTCAFLTSVDWTPPDPAAQVNESEWTGREQVTVFPLNARWLASVQIEPKMSEDDALDLMAFRTQLRGRVNSFRMPATLLPQFSVSMPLQVNGAGQTGFSLAIKNGPVGAVIKRGHKFTVGDQLLMNMATVTVNGSGQATLTFSNPLRASPANSAAIEIVNPTCLVKLANPGPGWTGSYPNMIDFTKFDVRETF
jgi:hypothetical protein